MSSARRCCSRPRHARRCTGCWRAGSRSCSRRLRAPARPGAALGARCGSSGDLSTGHWRAESRRVVRICHSCQPSSVWLKLSATHGLRTLTCGGGRIRSRRSEYNPRLPAQAHGQAPCLGAEAVQQRGSPGIDRQEQRQSSSVASGGASSAQRTRSGSGPRLWRTDRACAQNISRCAGAGLKSWTRVSCRPGPGWSRVRPSRTSICRRTSCCRLCGISMPACGR